MEKKHMILIGILVAIIAILAIGILMSGNLLQQEDSKVLSVSSDDRSMSGVLRITEWSNVEPNANGTYNITQFINRYGGLMGNSNDIIIENGKAEYTLHNNTQFFAVSNNIQDIKPEYNDTDVSVTVEYLHNGEAMLTSSNRVTIFNDCPVSFGIRMYSVNGTPISDSDINIDIPELADVLNSMAG